MNKIISITMALSLSLLISLKSNAQNTNKLYSEKVRNNASTFHKNFSTGEFDKNGTLVNDKIYVNSNSAIVIGKDKFVARIKRFHTPYPALKLRDHIILLDENEVALIYLMQATQDGPYGSIPASGRKINMYGAEFFTMDDQAKMKELLTITQLDRMVKQIKGDEPINEYEIVILEPTLITTLAYKKMIKSKMEGYVQDFNIRNMDGLKSFFSDSIKVNWNGKKGTGFDAVKEGLNIYMSMMPDLTFHIEKNIAEGDRGALACTMIGTYNNTSKSGTDGKPAMKRVEAKEATHFKFNNTGKIIEMLVVSNSFEVNNQIN